MAGLRRTGRRVPFASALRAGARCSAHLATVVLAAIFFAIASPTAAQAADGMIKLALTPVGQPGSYFDVTMRPGETETFQVDIANHGTTRVAARTYAADVYTIIDGGFGARLRDAPQTGTTGWLAYPTVVLDLAPEESVRRPFTLTVPSFAGSGEYITSLILENDKPIRGDGAVVLDQVIRQAVAIVITIPGPRTPGLAIGDAAHLFVAGRSVVSIAVENTGNVRLKPTVSYILLNSAGYQIGQGSLPMDTFYAETATSVELPLASPLAPGSYTVQLTLDDQARAVRAERSAIAFTVDAQPDAGSGRDAGPDLTQLVEILGDGQLALPLWVVMLGCAGLGLAIGLLAFKVRSRRRARPRER